MSAGGATSGAEMLRDAEGNAEADSGIIWAVGVEMDGKREVED